MPEQLTPGVVQRLDDFVARLVAPNPGPLTGAGTNTYLVGQQEVAVIDPGPDDPVHLRAILDQAAGRICWIVCTHTHTDHSPAAATLKKLTGAKLVGMTAPDTREDFNPGFDQILAEGEVVSIEGLALRAVFTPGHASNHLCFLLESTGMLFTGDHIMQGSTVVISPPDGNMRQYLSSLRRLHQVDMKVVAPGHGYLIEGPHDEVDRLIRHRLRREEKVLEALRKMSGGATLEGLLPAVYDDVPAVLHPMARRSLRAHLEKLVEEDQASQVDGNYRPGPSPT
jgi:glyoxylase-like metal-dependent hydrolase (beta-lactamase superfamily II)